MPRFLPSIDFRAIIQAIDEGPSDLYAVLTSTFKFLMVAGLVMALAIGVQTTTGLRAVAAMFIGIFLILLIWKVPLWGSILTFLYLLVLGGLRRWLIFDFGWPAYDPLILIGPVIVVVCFLQLVISRRVPADTPLSRYVKYLLVIMALEVFNPLQGGLLVGLGGVLYYMVPLLWFYIGRVYGSKSVGLSLFRVANIGLVVAAAYGLKQVFLGLSSSETEWLNTVGWGSMAVSVNAIRVFSTFASQQEYAMVVSVACTISAGFLIQKKFQYLIPLAILVPALFYTGARGPIAFGLCAISLQWALLGRTRAVWLPRMGLALVMGVAGLVLSLNHVDTSTVGSGQADILRHQKDGLLNPEGSTAPVHLALVGNGLFYGFVHPLGSGLGSTTIAAGKLGSGSEGFGAESDYANLFISLGAVGGICYLAVIYLIFKETIALWVQSRNAIFLIMMGVLVSSFGQWLSGGLYCLCFLIWFSVGLMDRSYALDIAPSAKAIEPAPKQRRRPNRLRHLGIRGRHLRRRPARPMRPTRRRLPGNA